MSSLWMGRDHLVYVKGSGFLAPYTEEYKRYRYGDIQAVSVAKTSRIGRSILYSLGLLFFSGLIALVLGLSSDAGIGVGSAVFLSILSLGGLGMFAMLLRHLILGPTCVCDVQTSLSRDRIRPLNRFPRALEAIGKIEPMVRESQSALLDAERGDDSQSATISLMDSFQIPRPVRATFAGFSVMGLACLAALHLESLWLTGLILVGLLVLSLLLTLSLVASVRKATPESVRSALWIQLGLLFLLIGSGAVYFLLVATRDPAYTIGITGPLEAYTAVASEGGLTGYLIFLGLAMGMLICGVAGMVIARGWQQKITHLTALPSSLTEETADPLEGADG